MNLAFQTLLISTLLVFCGCNKRTADNSEAKSGSATKNTAASAKNSGDPAEYVFHRNVAFTDVTMKMPAGTVDYIDFDMSAKPPVIVVVTVSAEHKPGQRFTTTFTGQNGLTIIKEWQAASGENLKNQHVGLFVLPAAIEAGSTVVH